MKRLSTILLYFTILFLVLWQLPWCYNFFTSKSEKAPFTLYSTIIGDFVQMIPEEGKGIIRQDLAGNKYTEAEFDSILPLFYAHQLMSDERFPDSIHGVEVTPKLVQMHNFTFRSSPSDINAPRIGLYPLLESMSGRVDLEMPDDVFRITEKSVQFIKIASNCIDQEKSSLYTDAMYKKGFSFPALEIAGNPTTRKDYDEGYVILDAKHQLFHLKQVKGRPFVRSVKLPQSLKFKQLYLTEFNNRKTLAFMVDNKNELYVLENKTYNVIKTGIPLFNPQTDDLMILGDLFNWTVKVSADATENYFALDAKDYSLLKSYQQKNQSHSVRGLSFTSSFEKYIGINF